jgi:hypothetical protein
MEAEGCPDFGGARFLDSCRCLWPTASLELDRRQHTQRRVAALAIVEDLKVVEDPFANSTRVRHRFRSSNSTCTRLQNDSITALSKQSPTEPIEGSRPAAKGTARPTYSSPTPTRTFISSAPSSRARARTRSSRTHRSRTSASNRCGSCWPLTRNGMTARSSITTRRSKRPAKRHLPSIRFRVVARDARDRLSGGTVSGFGLWWTG